MASMGGREFQPCAGSERFLAVFSASDYGTPGLCERGSGRNATCSRGGGASKANYALFSDSVLQSEGKPQHWSTPTVLPLAVRGITQSNFRMHQF
jgi:hypothetical protein